jgi:prevent-host-death family protein
VVEKEMGVTEARKEFSNLVRDVQYQGGAYVISRHGEKAAAVVPVQVYWDWKKQRKEFFDQIRLIQDRSDLSPQEASQLASEAVAAVRSEKDQPS